jgi:Mg2+ and Co2+ transporter CorA
MRILHIQPTGASELQGLEGLVQSGLPAEGFVWIACEHSELEASPARIQGALQALCGVQLVDLHVSDLLNQQLPSHFDYTSEYDVLVFRRLAEGSASAEPDPSGRRPSAGRGRGGPPILRRIDTRAVGFAVFARVLLTVHPAGCAVRESYAARLLLVSSKDTRSAAPRPAGGPADLMLRIVSHMVDGYLALRRTLTHQLDHWQSELLNPRTRFNNWSALLDARLALHQLDEICEEQRSSIQDWINAMKTWPQTQTPGQAQAQELLEVRSRDVLEHIERIVHHVRRLEQSAEAAVQMHFSAQSHRTNDIMRTLTALTAIFLPLNLIAAVFGMNFDFIPLLHLHSGFWWTLGGMAAIAAALVLLFWRKRYIARSGI